MRQISSYRIEPSVRWVVWLFICFYCSFSELYSQSIDYQIERYLGEQGLARSTIRCVIQDSQGFLWIAEDNKLVRFDGIRFKPYKRLHKNRISAMVIDSKEQLWIGSQDGLEKVDLVTGKITIVATPSDNRLNKIHDLHVDRDENLWIGDLQGTYMLNMTTGQWTSYPEVGQTYDFSQKHNSLWLATEKGIFKYNVKNKTFSQFNELPQTRIEVVFEDSRKNLWIWRFRSREVIIFNPEKRTIEKIQINNAIWSINEDDEQNIWLGGRNSLYKINMNSKVLSDNLNKANNLLNNAAIEDIFIDKLYNIWVSTIGNGLVKIRRKKKQFKLYRHDPTDRYSLSNNFVRGITEDYLGNIWVGTLEGGLNILYLKTGNFHSSEILSPSLEIPWAFHKLSDTNVLVGNRFHYVVDMNLKNKKVDRMFFEKPIDYKNPLNDLTEDPRGNIWIACNKLLVYNKTTKQFSTKLDSLAEHWGKLNTVSSIDGTIWAGSLQSGLVLIDSDLSLIKSNYSIYYNQPNDSLSISSNNISVIHQDESGKIWIGTYDAGLNRYDKSGDNFIRYKGLPNETIYGILDDSHGFLWISSNMGISRYDPEKQISINFGLEDGLQGMEFHMGSFYKAQDGKMYFGGMNGLNAFYPDSIKINEIPPKISFTGVKVLQQDLITNYELSGRKVLSKEIAYTDDFILEHDENDLTFSFAALDFTEPDKNQYAYKLLPVNSTWNYLENKSDLTLANLKPGEYQLHVKGSNNDGIWNEEGKIISFKILSPWWQTYWAYTLYTIGVLSVFIGFTRWRERHLKSQKISEEKFRGVFNSMIDVFIRRSLDGIIQLASPSLLDVTGYTPEELTGKHVSDYFVDPHMHETIKQKLLEHGGIHNFQLEIFKKDKSIITISSNAKLYFDSKGKQIGIESVFRDITQELSVKSILEESEEKFRGVFESISDVFVRGNSKGDVILVSPSVFDITGYTVEEIMNQNISDYLVKPEDQKFLYQKLIEEGGVQYMESEIKHKNGSVRTISINAKLYYGKDAKPFGVESIFRDITDKKITERKILESQKKLKELTYALTVTEERMKKQIAIDLHDDVGQLLTSSRMQLSAINYDADPKLIKKKINDVSTALLFASKATREVIFNLSPPQLQAIGLYAATHDWMKEEIEQKHGIRVLISGDNEIYQLDENTRFLLFRSIRELLINVVKHAQARYIRVVFINRDRFLEIVVKDDGIGFEYDPKNFKFSKKGLGLFSIEERVSNLGGSMTIVSRQNFGTEIRLIIPVG